MIMAVILAVSGYRKWPWLIPLATAVVASVFALAVQYHWWAQMFGTAGASERWIYGSIDTLGLHYVIFGIARGIRYLRDRSKKKSSAATEMP